MIDILEEKPKARYEETTRMSGFYYYRVDEIDTWLEKLKAHYEPYDELLKAEPLIPLDIRSVLEKEGMPILIDEGWFNELKEKAEKLGDISTYPEIKFGPLTVLEYLDLVELQAETYTIRAIEAEEKLRVAKTLIMKWREEIREYPDTTEGQFAKVAVGLCSNELDEILEAEEDDQLDR